MNPTGLDCSFSIDNTNLRLKRTKNNLEAIEDIAAGELGGIETVARLEDADVAEALVDAALQHRDGLVVLALGPVQLGLSVPTFISPFRRSHND